MIQLLSKPVGVQVFVRTPDSLNYTYNSAIKTGAGIKKIAQGIYPEIKQQGSAL